MTVRWGIAGPGAIATQFATGLSQIEGGHLVAVGSRSLERAAAFASRFGAPDTHGSYESLAENPNVDVVYVATPHSFHARDTLMFLEAGKHVLCEKPFAINQVQARQMAKAARDRGLFLMEAMWSRFLPAYAILRDLLEEGVIGDPQVVEADFGFRRSINPASRLFDLAQGGGATLDVGIYPVQLCSMVLGTPERVVAAGRLGETGADEQVAAILAYSRGRLGVVKAAIRTEMACTARLSGTDGFVEFPKFMHNPRSLTVTSSHGSRQIDATWEGEGLRFQAVEVHRCIAEGLVESPIMPVDETIDIAGTLDRIREQIGLSYPGE